jgi:GTP 3',8-cyclase
MTSNLVDSFGRVSRKLRISVTDRCNMRCIYCMPQNFTDWLEQENILTYDEIHRLACIFSKLGIERIRITGGEPLVRPRVERLISMLSSISEIRTISMTTNGLLLGENASILKQAGLSSVNVSLDTFKEQKFESMGGRRGKDKVLKAIIEADAVGLKVKVNTVLVKGWNDDEAADFAKFARNTGIVVRFIEFMPLDGSGIWRSDLVVSKTETLNRISHEVGKLIPVGTDDASEPATLYSFIDGIGKVGFISSMTKPFCSNCDRVRLSSDGKILTCLYEEPGYDVKSMLRDGRSDEDIAKFIQKCMKKKPEGIIKLIKTNSLRPTLNYMHKIGG